MERGPKWAHQLDFASIPVSPVASTVSDRVLCHRDAEGVVYLLPPASRGREAASIVATLVLALIPLAGIGLEVWFIARYAPLLSTMQWVSEAIMVLMLLGLLSLMPLSWLVRGYRQGLFLDLGPERLIVTRFGRFGKRTFDWPREQIRDMAVVPARRRLFLPRVRLRVRLHAGPEQVVDLVYHDPRRDLPSVVAQLRWIMRLDQRG